MCWRSLHHRCRDSKFHIGWYMYTHVTHTYYINNVERGIIYARTCLIIANNAVVAVPRLSSDSGSTPAITAEDVYTYMLMWVYDSPRTKPEESLIFNIHTSLLRILGFTQLSNQIISRDKFSTPKHDRYCSLDWSDYKNEEKTIWIYIEKEIAASKFWSDDWKIWGRKTVFE